MSNATEVPTAGTFAGKYLTVVLGNETYGIPVLKVREIIRMQKITPVPHMPAFVRGVINLRGRMVPIVDLRLKFGLKADFADRTCIIVVQVRVAGGQAVAMGLIVDSVEEVTNLTAADIDPPPNFGAGTALDYLFGIAKTKGQVKMLLDIDRVIAPEAAKVAAPAAPAA
jgi:purine-binding chemotaxis protein CheW